MTAGAISPDGKWKDLIEAINAMEVNDLLVWTEDVPKSYFLIRKHCCVEFVTFVYNRRNYFVRVE